MTNPKIRDARAAVRLLRKELGAESKATVWVALAAIDAGLVAAAEDAPAPVPAVVGQLPITLGELEAAVVSAALEERRLRLRLDAFGASISTKNRELMRPTMALDYAVERLALATEAQTARKMGAA